MGLRISLHHFVVCLILVASARCWPAATVAPELELAAQPSSNASSLTPQSKELSKKFNLSLTGIVLLLTVATYWILMRYTPNLSHEIALPAEVLEKNIAAVLSKAWPENYMGPLPKAMPSVLFCKPYMGCSIDTGPDRRIFIRGAEVFGMQGSSEVTGPSTSQSIPPSVKRAIKTRTFSPVMRSLVQVAVWNHVSLWLVLAMVANTVVYNGFASNNLTNDSPLRLILVALYALANLLSQWHVSAQLYHNFNFTAFQTSWTFLCSDFVFLNCSDYRFHRFMDGSIYPLAELHERASDEVWATLDLELFGKTERSCTYQLLEGIHEVVESCDFGADDGRQWELWELNDKRRQSHLIARSADKAESDFDKLTKPVRDAEIKGYEKAAETVLDRMLANITALLGICLATALAPWTSTEKNDATASQLGSYALLLTISTGFLAITGIVGQLANATESARTLLKLQERTINAASTNKNTANNPIDVNPLLSFSEGIEDQPEVTVLRLWHLASPRIKLASILLGPALTFIPRFNRVCTDQAKIYFTVNKRNFALKTDFEESLRYSTRLSCEGPVPQPELKD